VRTPQAELRVSGGALALGGLPRVVGTISSDWREAARSSPEVPSDIVEIRLDEIGETPDWLERCRAIEAEGFPVLLTIRLSAEGGKWQGSEQERLNQYERALDNLSSVDVEFRSEIAIAVSRRAKELGKVCIVSYHDFERTPPLTELQNVLSNAQEIASVVKLATMITDDLDVQTLRDLLRGPWKVPVCVMGMGPLGAPTRVAFVTLGSCLTYGYLDKPVAPGQPSAVELVSQLRAILPAYDEDRLLRRRALKGVASGLASAK
jgi:3-dehydroquinate dehydratase-1